MHARVYIHEPMTTRKNMCTFVCVYTLAGGDTLFEIPRESAGEREKERVWESRGIAEQRKGTTTWRIVALRELSRIATVRGRE